MARPLDRLIDLAPQWALLLARSDSGSEWVASPVRPSGEQIDPTRLRIWVDFGSLAVSELEPGRRFPSACPELHINGGHDFCVGREIYDPGDDEQVRRFWQAVGEFLINADFAVRHGFWPTGRWLSHGPEAADAQLEAEAAAAEAGIANDYSAWLEAGEGRLAEWFLKMKPAAGGRPINPACPLGCQEDRMPGTKAKHCPHRKVLARLADSEFRRQHHNERFFRALRKQGRQCCGTVSGCPLESPQIVEEAA